MICKICAQAVEESARQHLKDYDKETYQSHLIAAHDYPAPVEAAAPVMTNEQLTDALAELTATVEELRNEVERLKGGTGNANQGGSDD